MSAELLCPVPPNIATAVSSSNARTPNTAIEYNCTGDLTYPDGSTTQTITCQQLGPAQANWTALNHTECIGSSSSTLVITFI